MKNRFLNRFFHLSDIPGSENSFSQGIHFFNEFFIRVGGNEVSGQVETELFYLELCWSF